MKIPLQAIRAWFNVLIPEHSGSSSFYTIQKHWWQRLNIHQRTWSVLQLWIWSCIVKSVWSRSIQHWYVHISATREHPYAFPNAIFTTGRQYARTKDRTEDAKCAIDDSIHRTKVHRAIDLLRTDSRTITCPAYTNTMSALNPAEWFSRSQEWTDWKPSHTLLSRTWDCLITPNATFHDGKHKLSMTF